MGTVGAALFGVIGACIGWVAVEFLGRPVRAFFELRTEVRRRMLQFDNLPVRPMEVDDDGVVGAGARIYSKRSNRWDEAIAIFRDLGSRMRSFGETESLAALAISTFTKFDPIKAGGALIGLSNTLDRDRNERRVHRRSIEKALCFPGPDRL